MGIGESHTAVRKSLHVWSCELVLIGITGEVLVGAGISNAHVIRHHQNDIRSLLRCCSDRPGRCKKRENERKVTAGKKHGRSTKCGEATSCRPRSLTSLVIAAESAGTSWIGVWESGRWQQKTAGDDEMAERCKFRKNGIIAGAHCRGRLRTSVQEKGRWVEAERIQRDFN